MSRHKVGYGKPPKATQFKRGRSGNPKGRPKGSRNLATDLAAELGELITVREDDLIRDCSKRNSIILNPFRDSGTTVLAAERTGRIARLIELDPLYVDVAIRRWEATSGTAPQHAAARLINRSAKPFCQGEPGAMA